MVLPRVTPNVRLVLRALTAAPGRELYGMEVVRGASLPSGTVYPLLARIEGAGWATSRREDIDPRSEGRPVRRLYRVTPEGEAALREVSEREAAQLSALGIPAAGPEPLSIGGLKIPVVIDERQPPGTIGLISAWREGGEVKASAAVAVNVTPEPGCPHPRARINKGLCGACGTNVGK